MPPELTAGGQSVNSGCQMAPAPEASPEGVGAAVAAALGSSGSVSEEVDPLYGQRDTDALFIPAPALVHRRAHAAFGGFVPSREGHYEQLDSATTTTGAGGATAQWVVGESPLPAPTAAAADGMDATIEAPPMWWMWARAFKMSESAAAEAGARESGWSHTQTQTHIPRVVRAGGVQRANTGALSAEHLEGLVRAVRQGTWGE